MGEVRAPDTSGLPRLPRVLESDPQGEELRDWLAERLEPIGPGGGCLGLRLEPGPALFAALFDARRARRLVRGMDAATRRLEDLARGVAARSGTGAEAGSRGGAAAVNGRGGASGPLRMARLLVCSADGSPRFYRLVEKLASAQRGRVFVIVVESDAVSLAEPVFGEGAEARALLVDHKEAVVKVLLAAYARDRGNVTADAAKPDVVPG